MELINYIGLKVKIILTNDYYFIGKVISADDDSIEIIDIKGQRIALKEKSILTIQEVKNE